MARVGGYMLAVAMSVSAAAAGCGAACDTSDDGNRPERFTGGTVTDGVYESSSWRSGLLPFPGGRQYRLEHHLGFTPAEVSIYFAFNPSDGAVSPCAGNSCVVRCVDDEIIWIQNDTCAEFWVRVVGAHRSFERRGTSCTGGVVDDAGPTGDDGAQADATPDGAADEGSTSDASIDDADAGPG